MASGLRAKLNRLKSSPACAQIAPAPPALLVREKRFPSDEALFSPDERALERIGHFLSR